MKKIFTIFFLFIAVYTGSAQDTQSMKTLKTMLQCNLYLVEKLQQSDNKPSNDWARSTYYQGVLALYSINPSQALADHAVRWGQANNWNLAGGIRTRNASELCAGQPYTSLYLLDRYKEERIKTIRACIDSIVAESGSNYWINTEALFMAMPVFAGLSMIYDDDKYSEKMHELFMHIKSEEGGNGLYNSEDKLWYRDKDFLPPYKEPNGENCYWSRGNGWVIAGLTRTLQLSPDTKHRKEYEKTLVEMFEAIVPLQREDGFWNVSLKDPGNYGGKELTGTSLFVYGMAWAINEGIISKKEYSPVVTKAWNAIMKDCVRDDGSLGYVQGMAKGPAEGQPVDENINPGSEDFALGTFLLAGSEMYKLIKSDEPKEKISREKEKKSEKESSRKK